MWIKFVLLIVNCFRCQFRITFPFQRRLICFSFSALFCAVIIVAGVFLLELMFFLHSDLVIFRKFSEFFSTIIIFCQVKKNVMLLVNHIIKDLGHF